MRTLKDSLINLGSTSPELRPHIRPILASLKEGWVWANEMLSETPRMSSYHKYAVSAPLWKIRRRGEELAEIVESFVDNVPVTQDDLDPTIQTGASYEFRGRLRAPGKQAAMPKFQYHSTSWDRVPSIMRKGLKPPRSSDDVSTMMHDIPTISTTDRPEDAKLYHPRGALLELRVNSGARYIERGRDDRKSGESLLAMINRWTQEALDEGADGVWLEELQSTVGNQTINPRALDVVRIVNEDEAPDDLVSALRLAS